MPKLYINTDGDLIFRMFNDESIFFGSISRTGEFYLDFFGFSFYVLTPEHFENLHFFIKWGWGRNQHRDIEIYMPSILFHIDIYQ